MATLDSKLVGVLGDRTAKVLKDLYGYVTVADLLHHYPRRYLVRGELSNISELQEGDEVTILAEVFSATSRRLHARKGNILEVIVTDGSAKLSLTFFNQAWREKDLKVGKQGLFAGKVGVFNGKRQLAHPDYELIADGNDVDAAVEGFAGKYLHSALNSPSEHSMKFQIFSPHQCAKNMAIQRSTKLWCNYITLLISIAQRRLASD
ncbi:MAG: hypothetical protein RL470_293 [Actinomycetota bacterium]